MSDAPAGDHDHGLPRFGLEAAAEHDPALPPRAHAVGEGLDLARDGNVTGAVGIDVVELIGAILRLRKERIIVVRRRQLAN